MRLVAVQEEFESKKNGCPYDKIVLAHAFKALSEKNQGAAVPEEQEEAKEEESEEATLPGETGCSQLSRYVQSQPTTIGKRSSQQIDIT